MIFFGILFCSVMQFLQFIKAWIHSLQLLVGILLALSIV